MEVTRFLKTLQRPYRVLTDVLAELVEHTLKLPERVQEMFSPIVYTVPLALLAGYLADASGEQYGRGSQGQWADSQNAVTVKDSAIEL